MHGDKKGGTHALLGPPSDAPFFNKSFIAQILCNEQNICQPIKKKLNKGGKIHTIIYQKEEFVPSLSGNFRCACGAGLMLVGVYIPLISGDSWPLWNENHHANTPTLQNLPESLRVIVPTGKFRWITWHHGKGGSTLTFQPQNTDKFQWQISRILISKMFFPPSGIVVMVNTTQVPPWQRNYVWCLFNSVSSGKILSYRSCTS